MNICLEFAVMLISLAEILYSIAVNVYHLKLLNNEVKMYFSKQFYSFLTRIFTDYI